MSYLCYLQKEAPDSFTGNVQVLQGGDRCYNLTSQREKPVLKSLNLHISVCAVSTMNFIIVDTSLKERALCAKLYVIFEAQNIFQTKTCSAGINKHRSETNLKEPSGFQQIAAYK